MRWFWPVTGLVVALAAPGARAQEGDAQPPPREAPPGFEEAEWLWDAPRERWVRPEDVRRFRTERGQALPGERARPGDPTHPPAAAQPHQDLTLTGALATAPRSRVVLRGRLEALRPLRLAPQPGRAGYEEHLLATLRFEDGSTAPLDLGPRPAIGDLPLAVGDVVTVRAVPGEVDGRPVLMAEAIRTRGERREVDWSAAWTPPEPPPPEPDLAQGAGTQFVLRGRLGAPRTVEVAGARQPAVPLTLDDGREVMVTLGPGGALPQGLAPGERVAVRGRWARLDGERQVLEAEALRREGEWAPVRRGE
ncbi:MAG: hypothetical protein M9894_23885 [Planctomycetes bacterium]|nr:hypothetical protein [Planctomycetota bacterium]